MFESNRRVALATAAVGFVLGLANLIYAGMIGGIGIMFSALAILAAAFSDRFSIILPKIKILFTISAIASVAANLETISPITVVAVICLNLGIVLVQLPPLLILVSMVGSHLVAFGYLYGEQGMYHLGTGIGASWQAAVAMSLLGYGALATHPKGGQFLFFMGPGLGALTSRRLLPYLIIAPICLGALVQAGLRQGYFGVDFAFAMLVLLMIMVAVVVMTVTARSLDVIEGKRRETHDREQSVLQTLRQSETRYRILTEVSPLIVWEAKADGNLTYANRHWLEYCGMPLWETLDDRWMQFVRSDVRESVHAVWQHAVTNVTNYEVEVPLRRGADGQYRYHLMRGLPVLDPSGKVEKWIGISIDIHESKQKQEDLREALQVRDAFLSMASHELKTPLTSLRLQCQFLIQLLRGGDANAFARDRVEFMADQTNQQVGRLIRLVNDMLDVARIRTGRLSILRERFDIGELVDDCVSRLAPQAEIIRAGAVVGNWDRVRIDQVLSNLLSNAVKYGGGNPITVNIESREGFVRVSVRDRGKGIALSDQERIFDRFRRLSDTDGISGLGLGLFISKQIILAHGGNLWVDSQPGLGSTFHFDVPLKTAFNANENIDVSGSLASQSDSRD